MLQSADEIARSIRLDTFLGVVAPVGVSRASFEQRLAPIVERFGYSARTWHLSEYLEDFEGISIDRSSEYERLWSAMDAGTRLRQTVGEDVLARAALHAVNAWREEGRRDRRGPTLHVFWSLKHPQEVATLRFAYGSAFHLVALHATEDERIESVIGLGIESPEARRLVERDRDESGRSHGQKTRDTFQLADVFVPWGRAPNDAALLRFLDLLFGNPLLTPHRDEHSMFLAFASGLRSGELSRQVGACMVSENGDPIALGTNDVPRRGGGLYGTEPGGDRDLDRGFDSNTTRRNALILAVAKRIGPDRTDELVEILQTTELADITEFGRAVHAEMDALLACARSGTALRGATLFVTTYPCHNCARHLIAAGIRRVVYVEAYPKSRALELHDQDIAEVDPGKTAGRGAVAFEPYMGIGPRRFFDYFSLTLSHGYALRRKDGGGKLLNWERAKAAPRFALAERHVIETERNLASELSRFR